jgi:predicted nucleic acid-binding protein
MPTVAKSRRVARVRERAAEDQIRYVETSALLASVLEGDVLAQRSIRAPGRVVTSSLTHAEALRAVTRGRATGRISATQANVIATALATFAQRCERVAVSDQLLERAGRAFPVEPVRTLDAIHLATAELIAGESGSIIVVTRDARVKANARALGWSTE